MPELPEVETMVRSVRDCFEGALLAELNWCKTPCRPLTIRPRFPALKRRIEGKLITSVARLAKRIVIEFESGDRLAIEPRMTGLMLRSDPPDESHLRLEFVLARGRKRERCWFWDRRGLGTVTLFSTAEWDAWRSDGLLGPDALEMTLHQWTEAFGNVRREIKVALLDQKLVSGIGNLYASEMLHRARIHPARRTGSLSPAELRRLYRANREILADAILKEGSTLGDGTYRNALNKAGGYQNHHRVYAREDEPCPTCRRAKVVRIVQSQRATFFCPRCQSENPSV